MAEKKNKIITDEKMAELKDYATNWREKNKDKLGVEFKGNPFDVMDKHLNELKSQYNLVVENEVKDKR